jgi:hypothetical protein
LDARGVMPVTAPTSVEPRCRGAGAREDRREKAIPGKEATMVDAGPPIALIALGLVLWLAVTATVAGISIQTIGLILFLAGVVWLAIELVGLRPRRRAAVVREEPVVRERGL